MSEKYRIVTVEVRSIRQLSIIVQCAKRAGADVIARSLIHSFDDLKLEREASTLPKEMTLRIFEWKADELGLA